MFYTTTQVLYELLRRSVAEKAKDTMGSEKASILTGSREEVTFNQQKTSFIALPAYPRSVNGNLLKSCRLRTMGLLVCCFDLIICFNNF